MKKTLYISAIIAIATFGLSTVTLAAGYNHGDRGKGAGSHRFENRVDRRQDRQWARIDEGMRNGNLSRREAKGLRKDQRKIARMERRFERDGYYSPRERRAMERTLDRASHRIKRAKHNDYGRSWGRHHHGLSGNHHPHRGESYVYEDTGDTYVVGSSSSTAITAQLEGFSVSWSASEQE